MEQSPWPGLLYALHATQMKSVKEGVLTDVLFIRTVRLVPTMCWIVCVTMGTMAPPLTASTVCQDLIAKEGLPLPAHRMPHHQPEPQWRRRAFVTVGTMVSPMSLVLCAMRVRGVGRV